MCKVEIGEKSQNNFEPGKVLEILNNKIRVKTGDSSIWLIDHEILPLPKPDEYLK